MGSRDRSLVDFAKWKSGWLADAYCEQNSAKRGRYVMISRLDAHATPEIRCSCVWIPDSFDCRRVSRRIDSAIRLIGLDPSRPGENL